MRESKAVLAAALLMLVIGFTAAGASTWLLGFADDIPSIVLAIVTFSFIIGGIFGIIESLKMLRDGR